MEHNHGGIQAAVTSPPQLQVQRTTPPGGVLPTPMTEDTEVHVVEARIAYYNAHLLYAYPNTIILVHGIWRLPESWYVRVILLPPMRAYLLTCTISLRSVCHILNTQQFVLVVESLLRVPGSRVILNDFQKTLFVWRIVVCIRVMRSTWILK